MIKITKEEEPDFWKAFKKKNPKIRYNQLNKSEDGREIRRALREHLIKKQYGLCCYCCKRIDMDDSLNEHIRPEDTYPNDTMLYENIIVSCAKNINTCGPKKDNFFNEKLFVSPLDEDCEQHFAFFPNGEIVGTTVKGEYTVDLLGLNSYKLIQARAAKNLNCEYCDKELLKEYLEIHDGKLEPFIDIIRYLYNKGYYENKEIE